jgi:hypothetical protein
MNDFVKAHQGAATLAEAAEATGLTIGSHQARASKYRSEYKIPLKTFERGGGTRLDVDEALAVLAEIEGVSIDVIRSRQAALQAEQAERAKRAAEKAENSAE